MSDKKFNNGWIKFDDDFEEEGNYESDLNKSYILFYLKFN